MGTLEERAHLFSAALDAATVDALLSESDVFAESPNYWVPREAIEEACSSLEDGDTSCTCLKAAAEVAVVRLFQSVMSDLLAGRDWSGAEWWCQVYEPGKGLAFHFDKDEHALVESGEMRFPIWSSVLYLTGEEGENDGKGGVAHRQGATVILDQEFKDGAPAPEDPTSCVLVYPKSRSYCVFDGKLAHGVLDSGCASKRVTFLVNWWEKQPLAVKRYGEEGSTSTLAPASALSDALTSVSTEEARKLDTQRVELGSALRDQVPEGAGVPFDHVLAAGGVRVTGAGASSIVLVDHEGFLMYPLDTEQASELGTGAVFVRAEDEGSEGSGDGGAPGGEGADS